MPRRNAVRIIGGRYRGRQLHFPALAELRPTPDRARETLFQWLAGDLEDADCLDLFAGSGALGFEALSRGARHATLVELRTPVVAALEENRALLAADARILRADVRTWLLHAAAAADRYGVIFLDPPYASGLLAKTLPLALPLLAPAGALYCEWDVHAEPPALPAGFVEARRARIGTVAMQLVRAAG